MRKLAIILAVTALLATMPSVGHAAAPFPVNSYSECTHAGGSNGLGEAYTRVRMRERGRNGTNYMVMRGQFQRREGDTWQTIGTPGPFRTVRFRDDAQNHAFRHRFTWNFRDVDLGNEFQWLLDYEWWDQRPGPDLMLKAKRFNTNRLPFFECIG